MANKAIFFDRDDTLIEDPGYINNPDQVKLLDGVAETLIELRAMGFKLIVVSNQSGVARGFVTEEILSDIHKRLEQLLGEKGASVDRIYYCPYHPEGAIPKYRKESDHRKPNPGMLLLAGKDLDIDLKESWMIGNGLGDIEAGFRAGCRTILVDSPGHGQKIQPGQRQPDYRAVNLKEVVNIIKMQARSINKPPVTEPIPAEPKAQPVKEQKPAESAELKQAPPQIAPVKMNNEKINEPPTTQQLLASILDQLKSMRRTGMFGEFYVSRFVAGLLQGLVFLCLLICIWFVVSPSRPLNPILISLGFAILLQLMALTFYIMQGHR
jgi:D-glycero-D-manno-heptose 1,7-bisphosphate phosphatase